MRSRMVFIVLVLFALPALAVHHQFHAQAIAIGGDAPSAGAIALAPAGGEGNASVEHYDANGIRFDQAVSSVRGTDDGRVAVTTALVTLRNIDILGRIHIDEISARVVGRQARGTAEAEITIDNLRFRSVVVDGRHIIVRPDAAKLNRTRTFAGFRGDDDDALTLLGERGCGWRSNAAGSWHRHVVLRRDPRQTGRAERDHAAHRVRAAAFDAAFDDGYARHERCTPFDMTMSQSSSPAGTVVRSAAGNAMTRFGAYSTAVDAGGSCSTTVAAGTRAMSRFAGAAAPSTRIGSIDTAPRARAKTFQSPGGNVSIASDATQVTACALSHRSIGFSRSPARNRQTSPPSAPVSATRVSATTVTAESTRTTRLAQRMCC